jgi:hypothetical protein
MRSFQSKETRRFLKRNSYGRIRKAIFGEIKGTPPEMVIKSNYSSFFQKALLFQLGKMDISDVLENVKAPGESSHSK